MTCIGYDKFKLTCPMLALLEFFSATRFQVLLLAIFIALSNS